MHVYPDLGGYLKSARAGVRCPVVSELPLGSLTPVELYGRIRSDGPGAILESGKDQIANESVNEPLDLLRKLPGVHTEQFNQGIISSDVGVRGFNSQGDVAPLKLLIDGIPSNIHEGVADLAEDQLVVVDQHHARRGPHRKVP
jgi:hypothetical protein